MLQGTKKIVHVLFLSMLLQGDPLAAADWGDALYGAFKAVKNNLYQTVSQKSFYYTYGICTGLSALVSAAQFRQILMEHGQIAGVETSKFVKATLREAGYTPEQIIAVEIRQGGSFCSFGPILFVPFGDSELERAREYYATQDDSRELEDEKRMQELNEQWRRLAIRDISLSIEDARHYLQLMDSAVTKHSVPLWKGVLVHEMSHIIHRDSYDKMKLVIGVVPPAFAYGVAKFSEYLSHDMWGPLDGLQSRALMLFYALVAHTVCLPLGKHQERRADQEMIDSPTDSQSLDALARAFEIDVRLKHLDAPISRALNEFFDEHPNSKRRAQYLRQAANKKRTARVKA